MSYFLDSSDYYYYYYYIVTQLRSCSNDIPLHFVSLSERVYP